MSTSSPVARPWLFGPIPDLIFGCGVGYALLVLGLVVLAPAMDRVQGWLPFIILFTGLPHYGATLERVLATPASRQTYGRYAVVFGVLVWGAFVVAILGGRGGSLLVTVYLTWSPWHYAAQNFGLVLMFLRRAQVDVSPQFRRMIQLSFVSSFLLVFFNIHRSAGASVNDPLYAASATRDVVQFMPLGIPEGVARVALVCLGIAYVGATVTSLLWVVRRSPLGMRAPAIVLLASQSVWFVFPVVLAQFVPTWLAPGGPTALAFIWVAIAHSVQYLWISLHMARASGRTAMSLSALGKYFVLAIGVGAGLWVFPVLFSVKTGVARMPHESGLDMLVAAAVNLHHFLLDGVIWKLRDPPVRKALIEGQTVAEPPRSTPNMPILRVLGAVLGVIAVGCWIVAAWEQEVGRRWAVARGDLGRLEIAAKRLAWVGRDGPRIHQALAKMLQSRGENARALEEYRRSIASWPTVPAYLGWGKLQEKAGKLDEAQQAYEAALVLDPHHASALDDLAHVFAARGKIEEAVKLQHRAVLAAPERQDLRRRYDALVVKLPVDENAVEEVVVDAYDAGTGDGAP